MCPLRLILIFLSATLAGFFVLRNLRSQSQITELDQNNEDTSETETLDSAKPTSNAPLKSKVSPSPTLLVLKIFLKKNVYFLLHHAFFVVVYNRLRLH